jgi:hypothetical protein
MLFPQVCPVLGIELSYDYFMISMPQHDPRRAHRPSKPFETGNVLVMSTKAFTALNPFREVPTTRKPKHPLKPEMMLDERVQQAFDTWCRSMGETAKAPDEEFNGVKPGTMCPA